MKKLMLSLSMLLAGSQVSAVDWANGALTTVKAGAAGAALWVGCSWAYFATKDGSTEENINNALHDEDAGKIKRFAAGTAKATTKVTPAVVVTGATLLVGQKFFGDSKLTRGVNKLLNSSSSTTTVS